MKQLLSYLRENRITQASFAERIGITQPALSRMLSGRIMPSVPTAVLIERETSGAVPVAVWVEESK